MPTTSKRLRALLAVFALAVIAFVAWGQWKAFTPPSLPLQGQIEAQEINVSSKVPGRVSKVHVQQGQTVQAGDLLFELDSPEVSAKVSEARAAEAAASAVAAKARAGARPEEIEAARLTWERASTGAALAKSTYDRVQAMFDEGILAGQKRDEALAQWRAAQLQADAARTQYEMALKGARAEDKAAAAYQAEQVRGVRTEAEVALSETHIRAPAAGDVAKIQIQPGEIAPQGFPVITLVNLQDTWAVLQIREDTMAGFAVGSRHTAEVPALGKSIELKVSSVAVLPEFATWRAARPGGTDLRTFEIRLRPVTPVPGLRPGMSVVFPAP